jgi:hypothetical protein
MKSNNELVNYMAHICQFLATDATLGPYKIVLEMLDEEALQVL